MNPKSIEYFDISRIVSFYLYVHKKDFMNFMGLEKLNRQTFMNIDE